jgi:hypothetical protein
VLVNNFFLEKGGGGGGGGGGDEIHFSTFFHLELLPRVLSLSVLLPWYTKFSVKDTH